MTSGRTALRLTVCVSLCLAGLAGFAMAEDASSASIALVTTDKTVVSGELVRYEEGFIVLRQPEQFLRVSPKHVVAIFPSPVLAAEFVANPDGPNDELLTAWSKSYLSLPVPEDEGEKDEFFLYCLKASDQISAMIRHCGGIEKIEKAIAALKRVANDDLESNARLTLDPELYRPGLLLLALMRQRLVVSAFAARSAPLAERIKKAKAVREEQRIIVQHYDSARQAVAESSLSAREKSMATTRLDHLDKAWIDRIRRMLGGGRGGIRDRSENETRAPRERPTRTPRQGD